MKRLFFILITTLLLLSCSSGNKPSCENAIINHYLMNWEFEVIEGTFRNEYLELRLEFQVCNANLVGVWGKFYHEGEGDQGPATFYELNPSSVGITLYWPNGISDDVWVDVWLENSDGSFSPVYTLLIPVFKEVKQ